MVDLQWYNIYMKCDDNLLVGLEIIVRGPDTKI